MAAESSGATTRSPSSSGSADALLTVRGLGKRFPVARDFFGRPTSWLSAVDGVDLDVRQGETLALVGESGCGKSTLARLVLRLIPASEGSVTLRGHGRARREGARAEAIPPERPARLPGPVRLARSADEGRGDRLRGHAQRGHEGRAAGPRARAARPRRAVAGRRSSASRTSSPAGSASAYPLPVRSPSTPPSSSPTSR